MTKDRSGCRAFNISYRPIVNGTAEPQTEDEIGDIGANMKHVVGLVVL